MVSIIESIDPEVAAKLQMIENRIVSGWREEGLVISLYTRADGAGLFAIMQAESATEILDNLKTLPFFPYMKIDMAEIN